MRSWFDKGIFGTGWVNALFGVALAVAVYFANEVYDLLNHGPAVMNLRTPLDAALPVVPVFVIPYVSLNPYVYASLVLFLIFRTRIYQSAAISFLVAWAVCYSFYFFLQTEVLRPVLAGSDLFTRMIRAVYAGDNYYNDFPSLHTTMSTILAIHWYRADRRLGILAGIWTALIVLSTVLIKQHYVADLAAGLVLAFGVSWLSWRVLRRKAG
jgi:membrane-associated phospholipid phosphatase